LDKVQLSRTATDVASRPLIRWSVQEIRRFAIRLARQRINPARIIAWSLWRRARQAAAQSARVKSKMRL
jgi:phosphohistidine phosphatase SixA